MPERVRCILYMGVVTGLIGLPPAQCQQQPAGPKAINQQQPGTGQPSAVQQQTSTQCVSVPFRAAGAGGAVLAAGRPGRLPRPENDLVRGAVPFVESEEHRLGDELGAPAQHLPGELDRQQVLHVHGGAVTAAGLFLRGHRLAAVEPCGRLKQLAQRAADAMNYAKYWKQGADKATRKHNAHIEKCNRVIEAGENGLPVGDTAEAGELRQQIEGMRIEALNLTSENKRLRHDLEQKSTIVADLSVRVDDAAKKVGNGNGPGNGAKSGENSVQVATLVDRINRLEETLRTVRQENERLKGA